MKLTLTVQIENLNELKELQKRLKGYPINIEIYGEAEAPTGITYEMLQRLPAHKRHLVNGRICKRPGCGMPLIDGQTDYCSRECYHSRNLPVGAYEGVKFQGRGFSLVASVGFTKKK